MKYRIIFLLAFTAVGYSYGMQQPKLSKQEKINLELDAICLENKENKAILQKLYSNLSSDIHCYPITHEAIVKHLKAMVLKYADKFSENKEWLSFSPIDNSSYLLFLVEMLLKIETKKREDEEKVEHHIIYNS